MPVLEVVAVVVGAMILMALFALLGERSRRNRRFARKLSPYERRRSPGAEVIDAEDWTG